MRRRQKRRAPPSLPHPDECRLIILKLIEQTIRDYLSLEHATTTSEKWYFNTAECFLFEDEYRIDWGGEDRSLRDFLDLLDIDIVWFREKVLKKKELWKQKQLQKQQQRK